MGKVIGILSLKGGVGKTTSVVSLGASLSKIGKKVLLIDGNLSAPNLGIHLDLIAPKKTLHHVLNGDSSLEEAIYEVSGMDVLPASIFHSLKVSPLKLIPKVKELKKSYDVILIDSSPSLGDETLAVISSSDELLVVTTPDFSTLSMTLKSVKTAKNKGTPITGIILNKAYNKNFELELDEIERTTGVPVMAVIPHDVNILKSQAYFIPSLNLKPNSPGNVEFKKLAALLVGEKYVSSVKIFSLFSKVLPKRQDINREIFYNSIFN